jgi:cell division protein FtsL
MTNIQTILVCALLVIWLCFSVVFLITAIQSLVYDRKREKREREQAARDLEYHNKRMESICK